MALIRQQTGAFGSRSGFRGLLCLAQRVGIGVRAAATAATGKGSRVGCLAVFAVDASAPHEKSLGRKGRGHTGGSKGSGPSGQRSRGGIGAAPPRQEKRQADRSTQRTEARRNLYCGRPAAGGDQRRRVCRPRNAAGVGRADTATEDRRRAPVQRAAGAGWKDRGADVCRRRLRARRFAAWQVRRAAAPSGARKTPPTVRPAGKNPPAKTGK